jgi:hypothetical protein
MLPKYPQPDLSGALFSSDAFIRRKKAGTVGGIAAQKKEKSTKIRAKNLVLELNLGF